MSALRPLIGVTTSEMREAVRAHPLPEGDPPQREMALGIVYMRAIERAGGIPVVIPPMEAGALGDLLDQLSGVCLSGGPDIHPDAYHEAPHRLLGDTEPSLDVFELTLARLADERGLPVLGICRGAQAMNVARGGTLHQHVADVVGDGIGHRQVEPGRVPTHTVVVEKGTRLASITGGGTVEVNSFHHQAVDRVGRGLRIAACAPDGLVEAIETTGPGLFLGVQWHAETLVDRREHLLLFCELVEAAARRRGAGDVDAAAA